MSQELFDELLEHIWTQHEMGRYSQEEIMAADPDLFTPSRVMELSAEGLILCIAKRLTLTDKGEALAQAIIRRHRLAERLLVDVLNLDDHRVEDEACTMEHTLTPGVMDSICMLLGHPRECPHGLPIPEGPCCRKPMEIIPSVVMRLSQMRLGEIAIIAYVNTRTEGQLSKLSGFGIVPGATVELIQKKPAFVLKVEETLVALESPVADAIYIRRPTK